MMFSKNLFKSATAVTISVVLLAVAVYYLAPEEARRSSVAFALGSGSQVVGDYTIVHESGLALAATFSNGSSLTVFQSDLSRDAYAGEIDATGLVSINVTNVGVTLILHNSEKIVLRWVENRTIDTVLANNGTMDMGTSKVIGWPDGVMSLNHADANESGSWDDLPINATVFPRQEASYGTGHWKNYYEWRLNMDELKNIMGRGSPQANITFHIDYSVILRYMLVNEGERMYGNANLQWSGDWGTLLFIYDEHALTSVKYNFAAVKLAAIAT